MSKFVLNKTWGGYFTWMFWRRKKSGKFELITKQCPIFWVTLDPILQVIDKQHTPRTYASQINIKMKCKSAQKCSKLKTAMYCIGCSNLPLRVGSGNKNHNCFAAYPAIMELTNPVYINLCAHSFYFKIIIIIERTCRKGDPQLRT